MHTPNGTDPYDPDRNPGADRDPAPMPGEHWRPRLADRINTWWINREPFTPATLREMVTIPPPHARAAIVAAAGLVVLIVWWLIAALVGLVSGIADAITATAHTAGRAGTEHVTAAGLTRIVTDPVHAYLTSHAAGLPLSVHTLWITWLASTGGLFLLATLGSRGARIGWTLAGALTAAMVYTATGGPGRTVAAGLTLTAWAVLSILAFNRFTGTARPPVLRLHLPSRPQPSTND